MSASSFSSLGKMIKLVMKLFLFLIGVAFSSPQACADSQGATTLQPAHQHSVLKVTTDPITPTIPRVFLSESHSKQCKVGVGEAFPALKLPDLNGAIIDLAALRGERATVVLYWHPDRWMARTALIDLQRDLVNRFDPRQIAVVGIAVHQTASSLPSLLSEAHAEFPQLVDAGGEALAKVGSFALPRIYVLDSEGTIVWFDIEYSEGTRRELRQTLDALLVE
ncbi:MAG: TlpA family protein disulfide reductase [Planctomycetales bacterium]|nr:TlpA family protein disulfide reductase [Planctomycetales bacterium]